MASDNPVGPARDSEFDTASGFLPTESGELLAHGGRGAAEPAREGATSVESPVCLPPVDFTETSQANAPLPYRVLLRRTWRLLTAFVMLAMHSDIEDRITTPFFYTRVHCCEPGQTPLPNIANFGGRRFNLSISADTCACNLTETYGAAAVGPHGYIDACNVPQIERDSPLWSHSAHCPNWPYVREEAQVRPALLPFGMRFSWVICETWASLTGDHDSLDGANCADFSAFDSISR